MRRSALALVFTLIALTDLRGQEIPAPEGATRIGGARWRHGRGIEAAALSPDGRLLATAGKRSVVVWDLAAERVRHVFPCDRGSVFARPGLSFSPDSRRLGYVRGTDSAFVWDLGSGRELLRLDGDRRTSACAFSADGEWFLLSEADALYSWELATGRRVRTLATGIVTILSPDCKTFVTIKRDRSLAFGEIATGRMTETWDVTALHNGLADGLAFSADGTRLAVVHDNNKIQVRAFPGGEVLQAITLPAEALRSTGGTTPFFYRLTLSADGSELFLTMAGLDVFRWEAATGKALPTLKGHLAETTAAFKLPDGRTLVTTGKDGVVRRWDAASGRERPGNDGPFGRTAAAMTRDGRHVATGDAHGRVDLWDGAGRRLATLRADGPAVTNVAFAPDGRALVAGADDGRHWFWEIPSGKAGSVREWRPAEKWQYAWGRTMSFSPDGRTLAVNYTTELRFYEVATDRLVWRAGRDSAAAFSPDSREIAVGERGKPELYFLDAATGRRRPGVTLAAEVMPPRGGSAEITALAWSADGTVAAALSDGEVAVCDSRTGRERRRFRAATLAPPSLDTEMMFRTFRYAQALAFSPDGQWLASGSTDSSVRVWEIATGRELWRSEAHDAPVFHVAFGPGGQILLSAGEDGQVFRWDLRPKAAAAEPAALWRDLASDDGPTAFGAMWAFAARPDAGRFLRGKIAPAAPADPATIRQWLDDLSSPRFAARQEAFRRLAELGGRAAAAADAVRAAGPSAEARRQLEALLAQWDRPLTGEQVRPLRAVRALELAGSDEARRTLREWAAGADGAALTGAAKRANP